MKKTILLVTLFGLAYCSPRNPYYKNHLSDLPYNVFFEAKQEKSNYDIIGVSNSNNVLNYSLPDTIEGEFDSGNCVVEVEINDNNQIIDINVVGMTLFKKQTDTIIGFDRYAASNKRIDFKIEPQFDEYVQFVKKMLGNLKFTKRDNAKGNTGKTYLKIIFQKNKV